MLASLKGRLRVRACVCVCVFMDERMLESAGVDAF